MIQRFDGVRSAGIACAAAATIAVFAARPVAAQTWVGPGVDWNTGTNWSPVGVPNSPTANVSFTGIALGNVNISSSVQAQSLSFSNPTGSYTLSSSAGAILSSLTAINVAAGVANQQTIQLAPNSGGNLLFASGNNLTITNNSTALGTTLLIGQNTVIGTPGSGGVIINGSGATEIAGTFATVASGNHIVGGLTKNGTGTLILSNANNVYFGGTNVTGGILRLGAGTAIPTGSNVTIHPGAHFDIGGFSNSNATAIGNLTLNGATFRVPSGSGDYYLNELTMNGGLMDFTGTSNFWLHFTGAGAAINLSGANNWTGAGTSRIQNDTGGTLTINLSPAAILNAGIILSNGGTNPGFVIGGGGSMRLSNTGNSANLFVDHSRINSNDLSTNVGSGAFGTLGSGTLTLFGGTLSYDGPSATSAKPIVLSGGGVIEILTDANLTMNGLISESSAGSALTVSGEGLIPNTLTLTNANTYTGRTSVARNGVLAIPTIANGGVNSPFGAASNATSNLILGAVDARGTLLLTGTNATYSTDRGASVNGLFANGGGGVIGVQNAATNLNWSGQIADNLFPASLIKSGAGTLTLANGGNNYTGGTYIEAGRLALGTGVAMPIGGNVTVSNGAEFNISSVSNAPGSAIGTVKLNGGTFRVPSGNGDYYLNRLEMTGGTVDFTGTSNFWLHFTGAGAGITVNPGSNNWIGAATSRIQNDTAAPLPIVINPAARLNAGIVFSNAGGLNPNFSFSSPDGSGEVVLLNTGNSANMTFNVMRLLTSDLSTNVGAGAFGTLGTGTITINDSGLYYTGGTATSAKPLTLAGFNNGIVVTTPGTNLTMTGVLSGNQLLVSGPFPGASTLTLTGNNTFAGRVYVYSNATLAVPTIGNAGVASPLGAASNAPTNINLGPFGFGRGELLLTGTNASYSTDRGVTLVGNYADGTGGAIGVQNAGTTLIWSGQITGIVGTGSLIKTGAGTLELNNNLNDYPGGTFVEAGTLKLAAPLGIPPGVTNHLTVAAGAVFHNGGFGPGGGYTIGTVTLNGGTFRSPSNTLNNFYYVNKLVMNGGVIDATGAVFGSGLALNMAGASITINSSSSWIGPSDAIMGNALGAELPITIAPNVTLTSSISLASLGPPFSANPFLITGGGTLHWTSVPNFVSFARVSQARLWMDDLTNVGTLLDLKLDNGTLAYGGPTQSYLASFNLSLNGGSVEVINAASTLTLTGTIGNGGGPFTKTGLGTLALANSSNSFSGGIVVHSGRLEVGNDNQLGVAAITVNPLGTLRYTASTSTGRTFSLFNGTLEVPGGVTLTMNGATVGGGFLRGAGTYNLSGNTSLTGATTFNTTNVNVTGPASATNFSNNGSITVNSGQTFGMTYATNGASGLMTVNGTANVGDFTSYGQVAINPGGTVNNTQSAMSFAGGSVTTIGIYNPANGQVTPGGTLDIGPGGLRVQGGFVRNNGVITGSGNLIIDYLGLVRGAGEIDLPNAPIRINGGQLLAGNSPGLTRVSNFSLVSTGVTGGDFSNATGIAGPPIGSTGTQLSGWSVFEYGNSTNTGGSAVVEGTPAARAIWQFRTVLDSGDYSTPGVPANFNAAQPFTWQIVRPRSAADVGNPNNITPVNTVALISIFDTATMQTVPLTTANLNAYLRFDDSLWNWGAVPVNERGTFAFVLLPDALGAANRVIGLTYTPVPEPVWAMVAAFVVLASVRARRRFTWFRRL